MDSPAIVYCNHGTVIAKSIGIFDYQCYISQLTVTIGEEMINKTIMCVQLPVSLQGSPIVVGQQLIMATELPYPPPNNVHIESNDSSQITFAWDEVTVQCSSLRYIITAINCGLCPNTTADKNVTCDIQTDISLRTNNTCMFAVQTEICGHLLGERSDYLVVHMPDGELYLLHIQSHKQAELHNMYAIGITASASTTVMPQAGLLVESSIIIILVYLILFITSQVLSW